MLPIVECFLSFDNSGVILFQGNRIFMYFPHPPILSVLRAGMRHCKADAMALNPLYNCVLQYAPRLRSSDGKNFYRNETPGVALYDFCASQMD